MNPELIRNIVEQGTKEIDPNNSYITAIEGPVCAGKSSLIEHLSNMGIGVILEYSEYVAHANQDFPKFPPKDSNTAKKSFEFFLKLEKRRYRDLASLSQPQISIDRSIYTLLAFETGARAITGIDIFDWGINRLQAEPGLIVPDHIYYLDVSSDESKRRAKENNISIPEFLLSNRFNNGFKNFFITLSRIYPQYVTIVSAERPIRDIALSFQTSILLSK